MHFDVRQWVQFYPQMAGARLLVDLMRDTDKANTAQGPRFRDELERVQPHERSSKLTKHVLEALGQILRVDPTKIDKNTPFTNLGMDSLMSLELRNRFEATLGIKLSPALLFTYSTTAVLAKYLLEKINGDALTDKTRTEEPTNDVAPAVEVPLIATPDDDADDLLALFDASAAKIRRENLK
jgi:acyl carrier protein